MLNTNGLRNLVAVMSIAVSMMANAAAVDVLVGDVDGFGFGCPNVAAAGTCNWPGPGTSGSLYDGRSAAEAAATNGAQITDVYSALFPQFGPNNFTEADVLFPFAGTLLSGIVRVASGDRQFPIGGPIGLTINGVAVAFDTDEGFKGTGIDTYMLDAVELAAANAAGMVILHFNHFFPGDLIAFDWFRLTGDTSAAPPPVLPEPASLLLVGTALAAAAALRRRRAA